MNNPVLISESFERAAYSLQSTLSNFSGFSNFSYDVERFERAVEDFRASVDRLEDLNRKDEQ
tara:strand:- start:1230 stop:1415 length:186 start_codon:yes stop_codon:yes gene_type:complete